MKYNESIIIIYMQLCTHILDQQLCVIYFSVHFKNIYVVCATSSLYIYIYITTF